jgi:hypothetical protein
MKSLKNYPAFLFTILVIFSACKKKTDTVDKCSNGFLDAGELGVDCGGNCAPCSVNNPPSLFLELNGTPISMTSKSIAFSENTYSLNASNDSLSFQFNIGSNGAIGTFTMNSLGTLGTKNGIYYMNASDGIYSISAFDTISKIMSGFLQVNLSRNGFTDTLKIRNCQFDYIKYTQ